MTLLPNNSGSSAQMAIYISVLAIAVALFAAPMLQDATQTYAEYQGVGIDRVVTGSVDKDTGPVKRYTIRKSVLD